MDRHAERPAPDRTQVNLRVFALAARPRTFLVSYSCDGQKIADGQQEIRHTRDAEENEIQASGTRGPRKITRQIDMVEKNQRDGKKYGADKTDNG